MYTQNLLWSVSQYTWGNIILFYYHLKTCHTSFRFDKWLHQTLGTNTVLSEGIYKLQTKPQTNNVSTCQNYYPQKALGLTHQLPKLQTFVLLWRNNTNPYFKPLFISRLWTEVSITVDASSGLAGNLDGFNCSQFWFTLKAMLDAIAQSAAVKTCQFVTPLQENSIDVLFQGEK